jgi:2,3-bisphosphoglycerate-independent phosphoglycerate mutase
MIVRAQVKKACKAVRIHILLDGRDVPETSALDYVLPFEVIPRRNQRMSAFDARIASGGGRMNITMDRYEANWKMVDKGWHTHVLGEGPQYDERGCRDRGPAGTIPGNDRPGSAGVSSSAAPVFPVGTIKDGDAVVFFNFRGDRSIEITRAFEECRFRQVRSRARAPRDLRRHAPVRRRPQAAESLPGRSAGHSRYHGRMVCQIRYHPVRLLGNAEVRPRDLFLER